MRTPIKEQRRNRIQCNVTDEERDRIEADATRAGLPRHEYIRQTLLPTAEDKKRAEDDKHRLTQSRAIQTIIKLGKHLGIPTELEIDEFQESVLIRVLALIEQADALGNIIQEARKHGYSGSADAQDNAICGWIQEITGQRDKLRKQITRTINTLSPNSRGHDVITLARKRMEQIRQHGEHHREIVNALGINFQTKEGEGYVIHADILKAIERLKSKCNPEHQAFFENVLAWAQRHGYDGPTELGKTAITLWFDYYLAERNRILKALGIDLTQHPLAGPHGTSEIVGTIEHLKEQSGLNDTIYREMLRLSRIASFYGYQESAFPSLLVDWIETQLKTLERMRADEHMRDLAPPSRAEQLKDQFEAFLEVFRSVSRINPTMALLQVAKQLKATDPCNRTLTGLAAWLYDIAEAYDLYLGYVDDTE